MSEKEFQRVRIWSGWLRLSHWAVGLATLVLLSTGWLIQESPSLAESALDVHYLAAGILVIGLVARVALMFAGQAHERFVALIPRSSELKAIADTLRFYISFGRMPLPRWYAQNPLWKPLYLFCYLVLFVQVVSGAVMSDHPLVAGFYLPSLHAFWAEVLFWFSLLHIAAVCLHDVRGNMADISAMLSGFRLFSIDRGLREGDNEEPVRFVSLDDLKRR
jgi:Ni/Fe-hydrogenase 1 B-type cytochrome subunit